MLEAFIVGMAITDKQIRDAIDAIDFTYPLAAVVEEIQKPKPEMWKVDGWLRDTLSVQRQSGVKVQDACLARLKHNADLREMQKRHGYEAILLRMREVSESRKRTAEQAREYAAWVESERKRLETEAAERRKPAP